MENERLKEHQYISITAPIDWEITIKRSRFIASLRQADDRPAFDVAMKEIMALYPKATHYCWAYRFNDHAKTEHSSDAGEPPGTAGRPILGALKSRSLTNICAIVTRYYGGIKLGVKGLIDAYGQAAKEAIDNADVAVIEPKDKISFSCSYDLYRKIVATVERSGVSESDITAKYEDIISGEIIVPRSIHYELKAKLSAISYELKID